MQSEKGDQLQDKFDDTCPSMIVESNATKVINLLTNRVEDLSKISNIVEDIKVLASQLGDVLFTRCSRSCNGTANMLTREVVFQKALLKHLYFLDLNECCDETGCCI